MNEFRTAVNRSARPGRINGQAIGTALSGIDLAAMEAKR